MKIFLLLSLVLVFIIMLSVSFLIVKLIQLTRENSLIKEKIKFAKNKINSARYGNFQIKLDETNDTLGLYKSLNNLFESIYDRDLVINEYREKEKENYNLKEEFIAALTHDLKVPIIAQDKTFDLFLQDKFGGLTDIQKEVILKLKESNNDLYEMVNSILETYKIENKGIELKIEKEINVEEFLANCINGFENVIKPMGKEIHFHSKGQIMADFDPFLIKRVINNLIMNSIKHSTKTDKIDIHLNKTADNFSIDIIDYGEGIDEENIKKIFNKYYSITNKGARVSTGLGLYLSNKIVKKHKGIIEVESKKNEGSIFRIILPVKQN